MKINPLHQTASAMQACTCHMGCALFSLFTRFEEPLVVRRRLARLSRSLTGDLTTTSTRRPSLLAAGTTAAHIMLQKLSLRGRASATRRGSDHPPQAQEELTLHISALTNAPGDKDGFLVETAGTDKHARCGTIRWAGASTAKVLPTEGPSESSPCGDVYPPSTSLP